jgi:chromosome segregation ATPase
MNKIISFVKGIPWWLWVVAIIFIILIWQSVSGWGMSKKLYTMALDNLREDQTQIVKDRDEWIKTCEGEIAKLAAEKVQIQKEKFTLQTKNAQSAIEISRLTEENYDLQDRLNHIIISNDPDRLLEDLRGRGINIKRINSR